MSEKKPELKVVNQKVKLERTWTVKKVLTTIIIVILALLMIGGAYYIVLLFQQNKSEKENVFGTYDGTPVSLEYNNVFYNTLMSDSNFQNAYMNGDFSTLWSSYYAGYQNQVMYVALAKQAEEAGVIATPELVNKAIIDSGVYNDEDGKFSSEVYDKADAGTKSLTAEYAKAVYPYQTVLSDITKALVGAKEVDFVKQIAARTRSFEYFVVDSSSYPDDKAALYGQEHADDYRSVVLSRMSFTTEDAAKTAYSDIAGGKAWDEVSSTADAGAASETVRADKLAYAVKSSEDSDMVLGLDVNAFSSPVETVYGWTIFRMDSEISEADFTDKELLNDVKKAILAENKDEVVPYIDAAKDEAAALATEDFDGAAKKYGNGIVEVFNASNNIGNSMFATGFAYTDSQGYLTSAAESDGDIYKELFTTEKGYIMGPVAVGDAYIMVRVADTDGEDVMGGLIDSLYNYYAQQMVYADAAGSIMASDKFVDNFMTQFLTTVMSGQVK